MDYKELNISVFDDGFTDKNREFYNKLSKNLDLCRYILQDVPKETDVILINSRSGTGWSDNVEMAQELAYKKGLDVDILLICPEEPTPSRPDILELICKNTGVTPIYLPKDQTFVNPKEEYMCRIANKIRQILFAKTSKENRSDPNP